MDINLSISAAPSIVSNYLIVAIYEANPDSSVGPLLANQAFAAPHTSAQNVTFTGLDPLVCVVIVYENTTSAVGGTIRHQFIYDPSFANAKIKEDVWITVDSTTGFTAGGTSFTPSDNSWDGWDFEIEIPGTYGPMQKGVDWTYVTAPHYGFTVTLAGYTFNTGEKYRIKFYPQITIITPGNNSGGAKVFTGVEVLTADTALLAADMGNAIYLEGANPLITITLPNITTVNQNAILPIVSQGGSHVAASLKAFGTDAIKWLAGLTNELLLGQSEGLWFFKWVDPNNSSNMHWKIINDFTGMSRVGQLVSSYAMPPSPNYPNLLFCNGSLVSRATYKRLWNWVQTLDASMLVADGGWDSDANRGKFSSGDGSTTFRLPKLYDKGFVKGVDGSTRKAGSYEADTVGPLGGIQVRNGSGGSSTNPLDAGNNGKTGFAGMDNFGAFLNNGSVGFETWIKISTDTETKPKNIGTYLLIRI